MNNVSIAGRLTKDPREFSNESTKVAKFGLAVRRAFKGKDGVDVDFFDVVAFGSTAGYVLEYCHKGDMVGVTGTVQLEHWETKDGEARVSLGVKANSVTGLGQADAGREGGNGRRDTRDDDDRSNRSSRGASGSGARSRNDDEEDRAPARDARHKPAKDDDYGDDDGDDPFER